MGIFLLKLLSWTLEALVAILSVFLKIFTFFRNIVKEKVSSSAKNVVKNRHYKTINSQKSVKRNIAPLWQERSWNKQGNSYKGFFRTKYGSYKGEIIVRYQGLIQFYIFNPPKCLARHSHFACFIPKEGNRYEIHFSTKAKNIDTGIMEIEKILAEAHEL